MDGETTRLVATAAGAVIAGLGGALIAGWFNRKNTKATIAAATVQWDRDQDLEHRRWLRDRKVVAYSAFLARMREIDVLLHEVHLNVADNPGRLSDLADVLVGDDLLLIAPPGVSEGVVELAKGLHRVVNVARSDPAEGTFLLAADDFADKFTELERQIRADLG